MLLAIETSCDETAVALFSTEKCFSGLIPQQQDLVGELIYSQVSIHQAYGGVVPEIAAREHVMRLPVLINELMSKCNCSLEQISAVAVTVGPGLKGCLIVGLAWAKGFALAKGVPLIPINHIEGHVLSAEFALGSEYPYPTLAMIVSGGHTELTLIKGFRDYEIVARTRDDAAGEAFDKTATLLGLGYPGGPALSKKAESGDDEAYSFSVSGKNDPSLFSFSGLKTAALRAINSEKEGHKVISEDVLCNLAASIERGIVGNLLDKTLQACKTHNPKMVIIAGGVAANKTLRKTITDELKPLGIEVFAPPFSLCTDNAVMIGYTALRIIANNPDRFINWKPTSDCLLGPDAPFNIGACARFPIEQLNTK